MVDRGAGSDRAAAHDWIAVSSASSSTSSITARLPTVCEVLNQGSLPALIGRELRAKERFAEGCRSVTNTDDADDIFDAKINAISTRVYHAAMRELKPGDSPREAMAGLMLAAYGIVRNHSPGTELDG